MPGFDGDGWRGSAGELRRAAAGPYHSEQSPPFQHEKRQRTEVSARLLEGMIAVLCLCGVDIPRAFRLVAMLRHRAGGSKMRPDTSLLLRQLGAHRATPFELPSLHTLLGSISQRAGLPRVPALYWIPTPTMNAFALGTRDAAAVAVTQGLVQNLTFDELSGILAHEVAHIRNGDTATMELAQDLTSATELISIIGLVLLRFEVGGRPRDVRLAQTGVLLALAPVVSLLLQLALSRLREFEADHDAISLSGSAMGLMCALLKLEQHHARDLAGARGTTPENSLAALLRAHPETPARLRSLMGSGFAGAAR